MLERKVTLQINEKEVMIAFTWKVVLYLYFIYFWTQRGLELAFLKCTKQTHTKAKQKQTHHQYSNKVG